MLLCAALVLFTCPVPARALTLTAVNDTLLPLDDGTMPARLGGELYVPYSVFTMLGVSASQEGGVLSLSANGETLSSVSYTHLSALFLTVPQGGYIRFPVVHSGRQAG